MLKGVLAWWFTIYISNAKYSIPECKIGPILNLGIKVDNIFNYVVVSVSVITFYFFYILNTRKGISKSHRRGSNS